MKTVGIVPNHDKEEAMNMVKEIVDFLVEKECKPALTYKIAEHAGIQEYGVTKYELYSKSDFIVVLGGDGTLLDTGRKAAKYGTPLLGINLGNLGFLSASDSSDARETIEKVLNDEYKLEKRLMLESEIVSDSDNPKQYRAVNDVCISRGIFTKITDYGIYVNDEYLATFRADGIIISTPTGSTAYNLSAGGPIVNPVADNIILTPLSSHSALDRSIILMGQDRLSFQIGATGKSLESVFSADGVDHVSLGEGS